MILPATESWQSIVDLEGHQDEQLPALLAWAARSPFYRNRRAVLPTDRAGLRRLPMTTKQDLRDSYPFGMLAVAPARLATYHESSGTAGTATASYYTSEDWVDLAERYARKWVGIGEDDVFLVRTPYAMMVTGHLAHAGARLRGATVVPADNRSLAMPVARVARVLRDLAVTLTWSMPTETFLWAAAARAAGYEPGRDFPALRALFVGGEPLSPARRQRMAELWGVPVVEEYGSTETGSLAGQCPAGQLHLWADRAIFEVYHPQTRTLSAEGRGQLVVTPLYREAMPLLRYNLEDDVVVSSQPCPCGWQLPTVQVYGRSSFVLGLGGKPVSQAELEELVFTLPAHYQVMFWRARVDRNRLRVQLEVPDAHRVAACAELSAAIGRQHAVEVEVTGTPPGSLVPFDALTATADVVKPRSLFGPGEDWSRALLYY